MFFNKEKEFTEEERALQVMLEAKKEYERIQEAFNWASEEYFDIVNMELTIARMKYELTAKKLFTLCKNSSKELPKINIIIGYDSND